MASSRYITLGYLIVSVCDNGAADAIEDRDDGFHHQHCGKGQGGHGGQGGYEVDDYRDESTSHINRAKAGKNRE